LILNFQKNKNKDHLSAVLFTYISYDVDYCVCIHSPSKLYKNYKKNLLQLARVNAT